MLCSDQDDMAAVAERARDELRHLAEPVEVDAAAFPPGNRAGQADPPTGGVWWARENVRC